MNEMIYTGATEARKNWSTVCDNAARIRPGVIRRTHDYLFLSSRENMLLILSEVRCAVKVIKEDDGSYTAETDVMDLAENAESKEAVLTKLAQAVLDYAEEFYENYLLYSNSPNRKSHLPYITKAFLLDDAESIRKELLCPDGKN